MLECAPSLLAAPIPPVQTRIIDGNAIARELRVGLIRRVAALAAVCWRPRLAGLAVGNHPASENSVRNKKEAVGEAGVLFEHNGFAAHADESTALRRRRL